MLGDENSKDEKPSDLSKSEINKAAQLYFALNSCPSFFEKLYWKAIYINGPNSRISMLASRIPTKLKGDLKEKALKMFTKMSSMLGFKHISYHHDGNKSIGQNVVLTKNILKVKGEI